MYSTNQRWHATGSDWPRHHLYCSQRLLFYPTDSLASDWTFVSTQQQSWASSAEAVGSNWCCCEQTTGLLQRGRSFPAAAAASTNFMALLDEASHPPGLSRWSDDTNLWKIQSADEHLLLLVDQFVYCWCLRAGLFLAALNLTPEGKTAGTLAHTTIHILTCTNTYSMIPWYT